MLNTTHFAVGLAIGRKIPNPIIAFFVGVASHFLMDAVPHWDGGGKLIFADGKITHHGKMVVGLDMLFTFIILAAAWQLGWLSSNTYINVLAGALGGIFPDLLWPAYFLWGLRQPEKFFEFHERIQKNIKFFPGMLSQAILIAAAFWIGK